MEQLVGSPTKGRNFVGVLQMTAICCYVAVGVIPCLLGPFRPFPGSLGLEAQAEGAENRGHKSVQSRPSRPGLLSASPVSQGGRGKEGGI